MIAPLGSRRILTNAHAVANQVAVKVRKHGSAQKFNARVLAVGHEVSMQQHYGTAPALTQHALLSPGCGPAYGAGRQLYGAGHVSSVLTRVHRRLLRETPFHQCLNPAVLFAVLQCDIAMLTVDDDEFWEEDVQPLEINGLPAMQESVMVVGFPTG